MEEGYPDRAQQGDINADHKVLELFADSSEPTVSRANTVEQTVSADGSRRSGRD